MSLRKKLNGNPAVTALLAVVVIAVAGWFSFRSIMGRPAPTIATRAYFTADDGKTWFVDDLKKTPPFRTDDGKDAVQAVLVSCKGGSDPFVLYVWRYTAEAKAKLDAAAASGDPAAFGSAEAAVSMSKELKKPGVAEWTSMSDFQKAGQIRAVVCPPGEEDFVLIDP